MESRGKQFGFPWSAFCSQQGDHHVGCVPKDGINTSLYDLGLEWPQADALPYHNQLVNALLWGSPTSAFNPSLCTPRGGNGHAPPAGKQPHHSHSGPQCGEMAYLTFSDNIDYSVNHTGPYNQGDPLSELGLIGYHKEHSVFIISFHHILQFPILACAG